MERAVFVYRSKADDSLGGHIVMKSDEMRRVYWSPLKQKFCFAGVAFRTFQHAMAVALAMENAIREDGPALRIVDLSALPPPPQHTIESHREFPADAAAFFRGENECRYIVCVLRQSGEPHWVVCATIDEARELCDVLEKAGLYRL